VGVARTTTALLRNTQFAQDWTTLGDTVDQEALGRLVGHVGTSQRDSTQSRQHSEAPSHRSRTTETLRSRESYSAPSRPPPIHQATRGMAIIYPIRQATMGEYDNQILQTSRQETRTTGPDVGIYAAVSCLTTPHTRAGSRDPTPSICLI